MATKSDRQLAQAVLNWMNGDGNIGGRMAGAEGAEDPGRVIEILAQSLKRQFPRRKWTVDSILEAWEEMTKDSEAKANAQS